jgi:hypothetical protein
MPACKRRDPFALTGKEQIAGNQKRPSFESRPCSIAQVSIADTAERRRSAPLSPDWRAIFSRQSRNSVQTRQSSQGGDRQSTGSALVSRKINLCRCIDGDQYGTGTKAKNEN